MGERARGGIWKTQSSVHYGVMLYKSLGKVGDNLHPNNQNHWLEKRAQLPQRCSLLMASHRLEHLA